MESNRIEMLRQIAAGIAAQFGSKCEVVVHDVSSSHPDHSIVIIENGYITGRKLGDGASQVVLDQLESQDAHPKDHLCYLMRTPDGKILKCSSLYIRNSKGKVSAIFCINYDISGLVMVEKELTGLLETGEKEKKEPEKIINVNTILNQLIEQSVALVGKPVALMNKEDKVKAIRFLNENGAFLVTKSGDKVAKYFGISKYTLYSYIDNK